MVSKELAVLQTYRCYSTYDDDWFLYEVNHRVRMCETPSVIHDELKHKIR